MSRYFDRTGAPLDVLQWAKLFEDRTYQVVQQDTLADGTLVSTVWLGLDHRHDPGPPLIFETMVFDEGRDERECRRYTTEAEARLGHADMLTKYRHGGDPLKEGDSHE